MYTWQEIVWWTRMIFMGLFPKCGKNQWNCEIIIYHVTLPKILPVYSVITFWVGIYGTNGYTMCASPQNLICLLDCFFLMRGRDLGIRQVEDFCVLHVITLPLVCWWRKAFLFHVLCPPRGYVLEKPLSSSYSDLWYFKEGTWGSFSLLLCSLLSDYLKNGTGGSVRSPCSLSSDILW